jgi:hypothetical protein
VKLDATKEEKIDMQNITYKYIRVKDKNNNDVTIELKMRQIGKLFNRQWVLDHGQNAGVVQNQMVTVRNTSDKMDADTKKMWEDLYKDLPGETITIPGYYDYCFAYSIQYNGTYITGDSSTNNLCYNYTQNYHPELVYKGGETITAELKIYLTDFDNNIIQLIYDNPNYQIYCANNIQNWMS